ncbi:MAG: prolipoprotein diacylglyceryl transferase [Actinomycetia bacterium]|nr:prolipoprotein diacylglyceryl transferase [Actinomycetes bacterium]
MNLLAAIPSPSENVLEIGPLTIYFYGILIAVGVIVAIVVSRKRYVRFGGDGEFFEKVAIWAVVIGFLGARAAYVLTHSGNFTERPYAVFFIWEGGLALYGGLLFGALTVIYMVHKANADLFSFGDATAIGIPLAQAIGRLGNYFNQELFGTPLDLPWGLEIDPANRPPQYADFATFHPTFLYELVWNAFILVPVILWLEKRGKLAKGASFGLYVAMYAFIRFWMELLRTDTTFRLFGISRNGWVSMLAFAGGIAWVYWTQKRGEKRTLVGKPFFLSPQAETEEEDDRGQTSDDRQEAAEEPSTDDGGDAATDGQATSVLPTDADDVNDD